MQKKKNPPYTEKCKKLTVAKIQKKYGVILES